MKKVAGKVRVAIVGAGGISGQHVKGILAYPDRLACTALCDVSEENLAKRRAQLGAEPPAFRDWRQMLERHGDQIDVVDICLPHHLHAQAILDAAAAGKHVLCEKPMCTDLKDADRILAAVRKAGVTYMSAHNQLFMPAVQEARKLIGEGLIGRVRWLRSQDCFVNQPTALVGKWRSQLKFQGGGELIDTGYHPTYRLLYLADAGVVGVRGSMARFHQLIEGEDTASVQVRFANGALGEILTSWAFANPHGTHQIHVIGEKGQLFGSGNTLHFLPAGYAQPAVMNLKPVDTFSAQMLHLADCLCEGKRPLHGAEEGKAVLEIILEATADAQGWQKLAAVEVPRRRTRRAS
ncbi:MAG: Gfo/Idh/MocA family oxidoreductase [Kiritimatiellae bacterium]|nr:Gfo/Idh/MocA family oxidoreductase [Kiritimatiellia bacterium]